MVNSKPPPRRPPSTEGGSEARDVINPVMAIITQYQHINLQNNSLNECFERIINLEQSINSIAIGHILILQSDN